MTLSIAFANSSGYCEAKIRYNVTPEIPIDSLLLAVFPTEFLLQLHPHTAPPRATLISICVFSRLSRESRNGTLLADKVVDVDTDFLFCWASSTSDTSSPVRNVGSTYPRPLDTFPVVIYSSERFLELNVGASLLESRTLSSYVMWAETEKRMLWSATVYSEGVRESCTGELRANL